MGNTASTEALLWSIGSILALFAVLGIVVYVVHRYGFFYGEAKAVRGRLPAAGARPSRPASGPAPSSSWSPACCSWCRSSTADCWPITRSIPARSTCKFIGEMYPYSWAKTWHLQLAILWIAISWMGTAIYLAPLVARREPPRPAAAGEHPLRRRRGR